MERGDQVKQDEFNYTLLKERLQALKFLRAKDKKVIGEINYIERLLTSEDFSEERNVL